LRLHDAQAVVTLEGTTTDGELTEVATVALVHS
jgi:hypothetical protein